MILNLFESAILSDLQDTDVDRIKSAVDPNGPLHVLGALLWEGVADLTDAEDAELLQAGAERKSYPVIDGDAWFAAMIGVELGLDPL